MKNWTAATLYSDDGDENGKPSDEVSDRCTSSRDEEDEDFCSDSSKATDPFPLGCIFLNIGILLAINYTVL